MEILGMLVVLLLIISAYWTLVILPRQQEFKKHQLFVRTLQPGDKVVTYGGIIGTLMTFDPDSGEAIVRIAEGVEIRMITAALTQPYNPAELARNAQIGLEE